MKSPAIDDGDSERAADGPVPVPVAAAAAAAAAISL